MISKALENTDLGNRFLEASTGKNGAGKNGNGSAASARTRSCPVAASAALPRPTAKTRGGPGPFSFRRYLRVMAYETVEKRASDLEPGDRVMRNRTPWYVDTLVVYPSGDIEVGYKVHRHHPMRSYQTYSSDDPVEVIVGGFPDAPNFTRAKATTPRLQLVRQYVREALRRMP